MIPRTVKMAQEVAAQLTSTQLGDYGNIIYNGYEETVPNTTNKKAWQYWETNTAPVDLPSLLEFTPVLRGWTTNYQEYYTRLQPNGYGVNPGDPTMFTYSVHSYTGPSPVGSISLITAINGGSNYTLGSYPAFPLTGGSGSGATANIVVSNPGGSVSAFTLVNPGTGYSPGDQLSATLPGGSGFLSYVSAVNKPIGQGAYAQAPRRLIQNQVLPSSPNSSINNPAVIPYSGILYPVPDRPVAPPIDTL